MGKFGWAYVGGSLTPAKGGDQTIQFASGSAGEISGSNNLTYNYYTNKLALTGTMVISGTLQANVFDVITTTKTEIEIGGSTNFGNDQLDEHVFTGSVAVISGSFRQHYYKVTGASHTIAAYDSIVGISSSAYVSVLLPSASIAGPGKIIIIKDEYSTTRTDANHIAISASAGNTIDHASTYTISGDSAALSVYSDGLTKWFIY